MPEVLQFGPLMLRIAWVLLAVSGVGGYLVMKQIFKRSPFHDQPFWDVFFNALMIVFFVWKFSPVLFTPSMIWNHPLLLLIAPGMTVGWCLGIGGGLWYMDRRLRRMGMPRLLTGDLLSIGLTAAVIIYCLLGWQYGSSTGFPWGISIENPEYRYHPVNVYLLVVTLPMFIWLLRKRASMGTGTMTANFLTFYGMGLMAVSFSNVEMSVWIGLSSRQWLYLSMMIAGFALRARLNKSD